MKMAIRMKNRRRIFVNDREFIWWVEEDCDSPDYILRIISPDKCFMADFHLGQPDESVFLAIWGREFPGLSGAGGSCLRVRCPKWDTTPAVTPATVRQVIEWSLAPKKNPIQVDWMGNPLSRNF